MSSFRIFASAAVLCAVAMPAFSQPVPVARPLQPLNQVDIPEPSNLGDFIKDREAAIALGKALFWDMQVGSDGKVACATCHWHAGADVRFRNTLGQPFDKAVPIGDTQKVLSVHDFPLTKISGSPTSPDAVVVSNDERSVGSQGAFTADFAGVVEGQAKELTSPHPDPVFNASGVNLRIVTHRNSPSVINSVFNNRQNWDGRADSFFNGVNQSGRYDPNATVKEVSFSYSNAFDLLLDRLYGSRDRAMQSVSDTSILMDNGSLASQAMAPPIENEMGSLGRTFRDIGRKMLSLTPLAEQRVYFTDSVLGRYDKFWGNGLKIDYPSLIRRAFKDEWWASYYVDNDGYTQMESNFGLFWGLSIQLYQATLVSDETRLDKFLAGDATALSSLEQQGLGVFRNGCNICHSGPETTAAAVGEIFATGNAKPVTIMLRQPPDFQVPTFYDRGFYNIGVQPLTNDLGSARSNAFGVFSPTLKAKQGIDVGQVQFDAPIQALPVAIRGTFKAPSLRNVELTGPYNHNGGKLKLEEVIEFYTRGADFRVENAETLDQGVSGIEALQQLADVGVPALVAFLKSMTDERVRNQEEPFDHPELFLPNGVKYISDGQVVENFLHFPAVGAFGVERYFIGTVAGEKFKSFEEVLVDGEPDDSRRYWAHP